MTKWIVQIGDIRDEVSSDLLRILGFSAPYQGSDLAKYDNPYDPQAGPRRLASAYATGVRGDAAAMHAICDMEVQRAEQAIETARQKVAEIELQAAKERRAAEGIALAREREAQARESSDARR